VVVVIRRCAWCGRYLTPDGWVADIDVAEDEFVTHGICPDCLDALREAGESR
jgi:hypothetical protein